jgi:hypothetical protein
MQKFFKYILLVSLISLQSHAVVLNDNMQDVAPTLVLDPKGGIISSNLNYYMNKFKNKSEAQSFILPIIILEHGFYSTFNSYCLTLTNQQLEELKQQNNGMNYLAMILDFSKEKLKLNSNFISICQFDNSGNAMVFLNNLPIRNNLQYTIHSLSDRKTSKVNSVIAINNSDKNNPVMHLINE